MKDKKHTLAEYLVSLPGFDGEKDPEVLCSLCSEQEIKDVLESYLIEFSSPEWEGTECEITREIYDEIDRLII